MPNFVEHFNLFGRTENTSHPLFADPLDISRLSDPSDTHPFTRLHFKNFLGNLVQVRGTNRVMGLFAHALQTGLARFGIGGIPAFLALGAALASGAQALSRLTSGEETQSHDENTALTLATIYASMGAAVLAGGTSPFLGDFLGELASSAIQTGARLGQGGLASTTDALRFFGGSLKQGVWNILMSMGSGGGKTHTSSAGDATSVAGSPHSTPVSRISIETTLPDDIRHGSTAYFYSIHEEGKIPENLKKTETSIRADRVEDDTDITVEVIRPNSHIPEDTRFLIYDMFGLDHTNHSHHSQVARHWTTWDTHPRTQASLSFNDKIAFVEQEAVLQSLGILNPIEAQKLRSLPEDQIAQALPQATREIVEKIQTAIILQPGVIDTHKLNYNTNIVASARIAQEVLHMYPKDITWSQNTLRTWTDGSKLVINPATTFLYKRVSAKITHEGVEIYVISERGPHKLANEDGVVVLITDGKIQIYVTDGMGGCRGAESTVEATKILAFGDSSPGEALIRAHNGVMAYSKENISLDDNTVGGTLNAVHIENKNVDSASVGDSHVALIQNGRIVSISESHSVGRRLSQSIGHNIENPSRISGPLEGRTLAIFTDGAYKTMGTDEIATSVLRNGAEKVSPIILDIAREMGETDDITNVFLKAA